MNQDASHQPLPDFKSIFESSPDLYLVLSPDLTIIAVSDAYQKATMTMRENIIGRGIFEVFPDNPDDAGATGVSNLHASLTRVLKKKIPDAMAVQKYDIQKPAAEGGGFEERYWSPLNSPVLGKDRKVEYIIHRVEDVTEFIRLKQQGIEQHKLTEDLREKAAKMENEIVMRAQQLQVANENLRKAEQLKDQFLANMSHEIRTPMNAVIGFADLLGKTELNDKQREFNAAIKESGQALLEIINDILDFSKIEAGIIEFESVPFSIRSLVDSVSRLLAGKAESKSIELIAECDSNMHELVTGDPTRMTQILVNLLNNAVKFTEEGFVKLDARLKEKTDRYQIIEFNVADSGVGIPADKLNTVFERFMQASSDTTRRYGGTGLGLSIVKNLVELQGGNITVQSVLGEGTVFTVTLPFRKVTVEQLRHYQVGETLEDGRELEGVKLLIAEDNKMNQRLALEVLSGFGVVADIAENGIEAIEKCEQRNYDLILMDLQMAEMDGYQATVFIRKTLQKDIPIIAMTAHALVGEREKCLALGMNDYISKPFRTAELYRKIKNLLKQGRSHVYEFHKETNPSESKIVNLAYLKEIAGPENSAFVYEMIDMSLQDVPRYLKEMDEANRKKDRVELCKLTHQTQNSVAMMGASDLAAMLALIQEKCASGAQFAEIAELYEKARSECVKALHELKEERASYVF